jgi:hypothetical protein
LEWGHLEGERPYDGSLESYNGELLEIRALGGTRLQGPFSWVSRAGNENLGGIIAEVLYTWGMDVDRTVLTVRTKSCDFSFLPAEAIEEQPIDVPDFGVFIRNNAVHLDRASYRKHAYPREIRCLF